MTPDDAGLTHIGNSLSAVFKEIVRRTELRARLEVEYGRALGDEEFLAIAEKSGLKI